jgi:hypothetical protein
MATSPQIQVPRAERSNGPSERSALTRSQGNFLWLLSFLPEKKVTPRRVGAPNLKTQKHQAQDTATMRHARPTPETEKSVDLQRGK